MAWYLWPTHANLARASRYSKKAEIAREKNRSYIETPPFERTTHDPHRRFDPQDRDLHSRNCSRLLLYWTRGQLPDEARCWDPTALHCAP
nr:MAG TPA: hypothetical protein [Caudoviricetes sp.]